MLFKESRNLIANGLAIDEVGKVAWVNWECFRKIGEEVKINSGLKIHNVHLTKEVKESSWVILFILCQILLINLYFEAKPF